MKKAFTFGKFMPPHIGHEALIRFALTQCDFLYVMVCKSDRETMPLTQRIKWLKATFSDTPNLEIIGFEYLESDYPNTSESSESVSAIWAKVFQRYFSECSLVVTSEPYGEYVAAAMQIDFAFIEKKPIINGVQISASQIRENYQKNWQFLLPTARRDLCQKIVLLGTESTGKTTLTQRLAQYFNCGSVLEAGRDLIPDSNQFTINDLYTVAEAHAQAIDVASLQYSRLIIDTDIYITQSYADFTFAERLNIDPEIYVTNKADLYFYLTNDVPFVQDGTRLSEADRNRLDASHRATLKHFGVDFVEIGGDFEERLEAITKYIIRNYERY